VLGYDQETGFGLVQTLGAHRIAACRSGSRAPQRSASRSWWRGAGGRHHSVAATCGPPGIAGYWEYVLDEAISTAPAHPNWGRNRRHRAEGRISSASDRCSSSSRARMAPSIQHDRAGSICSSRSSTICSRLAGAIAGSSLAGLYATEVTTAWSLVGAVRTVDRAQGDLRTGDVVLRWARAEVKDLAGLFRRIWSLASGRRSADEKSIEMAAPSSLRVPSGDRNRFLKGPRVH